MPLSESVASCSKEDMIEFTVFLAPGLGHFLLLTSQRIRKQGREFVLEAKPSCNSPTETCPLASLLHPKDPTPAQRVPSARDQVLRPMNLWEKLNMQNITKRLEYLQIWVALVGAWGPQSSADPVAWTLFTKQR